MRIRTISTIAMLRTVIAVLSAWGSADGALPGDIAAGAGTPLVAAHSMTRALYAGYNGNLFQVRRASDSQTRDIGVIGAGGTVDLSVLSAFCSGTAGTVSKVYDQSGNANDLTQATPANQPDLAYWTRSDATLVPMAITTHQQWLRNRTSVSRIPTGAASQTEYFVVDGLYANGGCCYDYGNMEATVGDDGAGTMNALNFSFMQMWAGWPGAGKGPWGGVDFENGVYTGGNAGTNPGNLSTTSELVTVLSKTNGTTSWVLKVGDAGSGSLQTYWNGALPNGYNPLHQEGGLSLGEGGDGSNAGTGAFFEGVVIAAVTSETTDSLTQSSIASMFGSNHSIAVLLPAAPDSSVDWRYTTAVPATSWMDTSFNDAAWTVGKAGFGTAGTSPDVVVNTIWNTADIWLRTNFPLPPDTLFDSFFVRLMHDEDCEIYINGTLVLSETGYTPAYASYAVPQSLNSAFHKGTNVIAVHCHQTTGGQYIDAGVNGVTRSSPVTGAIAGDGRTGSAPNLDKGVRILRSSGNQVAISVNCDKSYVLRITRADGKVLKSLHGSTTAAYSFSRRDLEPGITFVNVISGNERVLKTMLVY